MQFIEFTDPDSGISYQYSEFTIANVAFIINFCSDADVISTLSALGKDITNYINTYSCCTIKFMAKEHLENSGSNIDIYAPAANHQFKRKEIIALQETLERLLLSIMYVLHQKAISSLPREIHLTECISVCVCHDVILCNLSKWFIPWALIKIVSF